VDAVRERVNASAREDRFDKDTARHGDDDNEVKTAEKHGYEKPVERNVMVDINFKGMYDLDVNVDTRVEKNHEEKLMEEVEIEISEDDAEEKVNDDDPREDDREHFIKGDGFKDDSEDTANKQVMKQDEAPKKQEITKKELPQLWTSQMLLEQKQES
jgi:hypothetical protein